MFKPLDGMFYIKRMLCIIVPPCIITMVSRNITIMPDDGRGAADTVCKTFIFTSCIPDACRRLAEWISRCSYFLIARVFIAQNMREDVMGNARSFNHVFYTKKTNAKTC